MSKLTTLGLFAALFAVASCTASETHDDAKTEAKTEQHAEHSHSHGDDHSHDHGHSHDHTPHAGVLAGFGVDGDQKGVAELKLHDDKGDLELWLTNNDGTKAFDLSLDSAITVIFTKLPQKSSELRVRNTEKNEDEDGVGNIRDGKTNYFIFPGDSGVDASFLTGKDFSTEVVISFTADGKDYMTVPFILRPHTH